MGMIRIAFDHWSHIHPVGYSVRAIPLKTGCIISLEPFPRSVIEVLDGDSRTQLTDGAATDNCRRVDQVASNASGLLAIEAGCLHGKLAAIDQSTGVVIELIIAHTAPPLFTCLLH